MADQRSPSVEACDNFAGCSTPIHSELNAIHVWSNLWSADFASHPKPRSQSPWIYQTISIFGFIESFNSDQMCRFAVKMPSRLCSIVSNLPITLLLSFSSRDAACLIFKVNILLFGVRAARLFHGKLGWLGERRWNDSGDKPIVGWHFFKASTWSLSRRSRISTLAVSLSLELLKNQLATFQHRSDTTIIAEISSKLRHTHLMMMQLHLHHVGWWKNPGEALQARWR